MFNPKRACTASSLHERLVRGLDVTLCNFFLWGRFKEHVYFMTPKTLEKLGTTTSSYFSHPTGVPGRSVDVIPERLKKLQANAGAHTEL